MEHHYNRSSSLLLYLQLILFFYINIPCVQANSTGNETDRLALLKFKQGITNDPYGILNSWNDSFHFCNWYGITCNHHHQRVKFLVLKGQSLSGSISPSIGNLSFLRILDLQNNSFHHHIPEQVGQLFRLQYFLVNNNTFQGQVPSNLSRCTQLKVINLSFNEVEGKIPQELGSLAKLEILILGVNKISGEIPTSLGNLSSLTSFSVARNNLVGNIPADMGRLASLTFFTVAANNLYGKIPASIFNISSIIFISTAANRLNGSLLGNIGETLPSLQQFHFGGNEFSGSIPISLSNASSLKKFEVTQNKFEGGVPDFGNHVNLLWLDVSQNNLGNNSANDLEFLTSLKNSSNLEILDIGYNNFGGVLPNSIANLSVQLIGLYFGGNQITGVIPEALQSLINLMDLGMEDNFFTGVIPSYFGKFQNLRQLLLWHNGLSGRIPSSLGNLTQLSLLILSQNKLDGSIPSSIGNCTRLNILNIARNNLNGAIPHELTGISSLSILLNLAHNYLTGNLPVEVGKLGNVNTLDVAENKLSGEIPTTIGGCLGLEYLYMQGNSFQGAIPSSLSSLRGLQGLDISRNNLTGEIPQDLQNLPFLIYLNLSFNNLEGQVPTSGIFRNASALSLAGNTKLCGGAPHLRLPNCPDKVVKKKGNSHHALKLAVIVSCMILFVLLVLVFLYAYRHKKLKKSTSETPLLMTDHHVRVSYQDLHRATSGFSSDNLIGSGSFGSVYKGFLDQIESPVAIKVLKLHQKGASKSFMAECNVLRNVRHRNLVKLLTYCSSLDYKQNEFKALIFEFRENGSLENWLHHNNKDSNSQPSNYLNFLQRLNIAVDVASVLHYLHEQCESTIIHCDLKPSNVLLDANMVAHVSDFGLARLFLSTTADDVSQSQSSSATGIKGTFGYAPPEYAMGNAASKEGDVYSYGILVLEMFSGKRPTDMMFEGGFNLHNFVKNALPNGLERIMDQTLLPRDTEHTPKAEKENNIRKRSVNDQLEKCLLSMFKVGVACSRESPKERMNMGDVAKKLHLIRSAFLGVRIYG